MNSKQSWNMHFFINIWALKTCLYNCHPDNITVYFTLDACFNKLVLSLVTLEYYVLYSKWKIIFVIYCAVCQMFM